MFEKNIKHILLLIFKDENIINCSDLENALLNKDIDYSIESQRNYLGDATSENIGTLLICNTSIKPSYDAKAAYVLPAGLIDATIIGAARYGLSLNKGWPFKLTSNCIYKNTFEFYSLFNRGNIWDNVYFTWLYFIIYYQRRKN